MSAEKKIAAIMVLYRCPPAQSATLQSLSQACQKADLSLDLYLYDNSPTAQPLAGFPHINVLETHHNPNNPGVSTAYNHFARQAQAEWLLLLDQDTQFPESYFEEVLPLLNGPHALILPPLVQNGVQISPHAFRWGYSFSEKEMKSGAQSLKQRSALNSGLLVKKEWFQKVGGYAEDVPLYFSDQVFVHRLKKAGLKDFYLLESPAHHSMASNDARDPAGFKERFLLFVNGARAARKHFGPTVRAGLTALAILRGLKLSLRQADAFYLRQSLKILR